MTGLIRRFAFALLLAVLTMPAAAHTPPTEKPLHFLCNDDHAPTTYLKDGTPSGFAVDLARALEPALGRHIIVDCMAAMPAKDMVTRGEADAVIAIVHSPSREGIFDFSSPLMESELSIFLNKKAPAPGARDALHGARIGVEAGSYAEEFLLGEHVAKFVRLPTAIEGLQRLDRGELDAVAMDHRVGSHLIAVNHLRNIAIGESPLANTQLAIAVRKGNHELLDAIDRSLDEIRRDGTYAALAGKWKPQEGMFVTHDQLATWGLFAILFGLGIVSAIRIVSLRRELKAHLAAENGWRMVFENSPVSLWEKDCTELKHLFDDWRCKGITDLDAFLAANPGALHQCAERIRIINVNVAALALHGIHSPRELLGPLRKLLTPEWHGAFRQELVALWQESTRMVLDTEIRTLAGEHRDVTLHMAVCPGHEGALDRVLVSLVDVTERRQAERRIHASEQMFRALVENSPDAIVRYDRDQRRIYVNPAMAALYGRNSEELLAKRLDDDSLLPEAPDFIALIEKVFTTGQPDALELPYRNARGEVRWGQARLAPEFDADGTVASVLSIGRDIHELKESERRFRTLAENAPDNIIRYDRQGRILYANPRVVESLGVASAEELIGRTASDIRPSREAARLAALIAQVVAQGLPANIDLVLRGDSDNPRYHSLRLVPERGEAGEIVGVLAIGRDITEARRAERDLQLLNRAIDQSYDAAFLVDAEGRLRYVNEAAVRVLGYSREELLAMNMLAIDPDATTEEALDLRRQTIANGGTFPGTIERRHRRKDGHLVPVEIGASALEFDGETLILTLVRDISERLEAERRLRESERQFRSLAENIPANIARYDQDGRTSYVNPALERTLGTAAATMIGTTIRDSRAIDAYEGYATLIDRALDVGEASEIEIALPGPAGSPSQVYRIRAVPERDQHGDIVGALAIGHDITVIRHAERESIILNRAVNASSDGAFLMDECGRFVYVNDAACRSLDYGRDELLGMTPVDIDPEVTSDTFTVMLRNLFSQGPTRGAVETRHRARDGRCFPVELSASLIEIDDTRFCLVMARDISARKALELELRRQADFQQTLLGGINDVGMQLMIIERGRIVHFSNRTRARAFGISDAKMDEQPNLLDYVHPDDRARIADLHRRRLAGEADPSTYEVGTLTPDGERRDYEISAAIVPNTEPPRIVAIAKDISERKKTERERLEHLQFLESIDRINQVIQGAEDIDQMLNAVLDEMLSIFVCDRAFLMYPCDPAANEWWAPIERTRAEYPGIRDEGMAVAMDEQVAETLRIMLAADGPVKFGPGNEHALPTEVAERFGIRSFMSMALHPRIDKPWQFGIHQCSSARAWTAREERLFDAIGHRLADALTALLAKRELQDNERKFRTLIENIPDLIVRYDRELRRTYVNPAWEAASGLAADEVIDVPITDLPKVPQPAVGSYVAKLRAILETGNPQEVEFSWTNARGMTLHLDYRLVPEFDPQGEVVSVLAIGHDITQLRKTESELQESYDKLKEFSMRRETAREEERKRIARDIHDELGQHLTALRMRLSTLHHHYGNADKGLAERTEAMIHLCDKSVEVVRDLAATLRPPILTQGIGPAIEWLAKRFSDQTGIACPVSPLPKQLDQLDDDVALAAFRVIQECFTNIARHARTERAAITVACDDATCAIEVRDWGQGFDPLAVGTEAFGLLGMQERVQLFGGNIVLDAAPGRGANVRIEIPLAAAPKPSHR